MKRAAVLYATREGHTALIAVGIARKLRDLGASVDVIDLGATRREIELDRYDAAVLAASVHVGHHEPEMVRFARLHRASLEAMPSAFVSVTLSQAGVEMSKATPEARVRSAAGVQQVLDCFYAETGWHPAHVKAVAGALRYTKYNFLKRFILKQISRKAGGSTDTSRDHVYTDWTALESFVANFAEEFGLSQNAVAPSAR
ncbi:MAG: flavodoxin domain-containing protein [Acidobacteriota bacterium]